MITEHEWLGILAGMGVKALTAARWAPAFEGEVQLDKFSAGEADLIDWLPQIMHECGLFEAMQEKLSYSAERIVEVWPTRFASVQHAMPYARNPQALANKVYANRMGNGDEASGDGWTYRGRCPIMLTGEGGYIHVGDLMGQDLVNIPHLIEGPRYGLEAAVHWWEDRIPDSMLSDQVRLRKRVNGGSLGLAHVVALRAKLVALLN